jgi:hypothetical protein
MAGARVADLGARLWLVTRFGCCVQVFHDYVADVTVVRVFPRAALSRPAPRSAD